jgi:hypothetical protein
MDGLFDHPGHVSLFANVGLNSQRAAAQPRNFGCGAVRRSEAANLCAAVMLSRTGNVIEVGNGDISAGPRKREGNAPSYASCSSSD